VDTLRGALPGEKHTQAAGTARGRPHNVRNEDEKPRHAGFNEAERTRGLRGAEARERAGAPELEETTAYSPAAPLGQKQS